MCPICVTTTVLMAASATNGRAENGPYHSLPDWARPHNMYGRGGTVEGTGRYHAGLQLRGSRRQRAMKIYWS
jgi:hypothetical protein